MRKLAESNSYSLAPMREFYLQISHNKRIEMDWYFRLQVGLGKTKIIFSHVRPYSDLFYQLLDKSEQYGLQSEFLVTAEHQDIVFANPSHSKFSWIFLIHRALSANRTDQFLKHHKPGQTKYVFLLKRDWSFESLLKSFPSKLRGDLYYDIPYSLIDGDAFVDFSTATQMSQWVSRQEICSQMNQFPLQRCFLLDSMTCGFVDLALFESHQDREVELSVLLLDKKFYSDFISLNPKLNLPKFELIYGGDSPLASHHGFDYQYFKIKSSGLGRINRVQLSNTLAVNARAEKILLVDEEFFEQYSDSKFAGAEESIVTKEKFLCAGGFLEDDPESILNFDSVTRPSKDLSSQTDREKKQLGQIRSEEGMYDPSMEEILALRKKNYRLTNFFRLSRQLVTQSPFFFVQGQLQFFEDFFHSVNWRLKPSTYGFSKEWFLSVLVWFFGLFKQLLGLFGRIISFLNPATHDWYWKLRRFVAYLKPSTHEWYWQLKRSISLLKPLSIECYWRLRRFVSDLSMWLKPTTYDWYWKLKAIPSFIWRLNPKNYKLFWKIRYFPRKIAWDVYCFFFKNEEMVQYPLFSPNRQTFYEKSYGVFKYSMFWAIYLFLSMLIKVVFFTSYFIQNRILGRKLPENSLKGKL